MAGTGGEAAGVNIDPERIITETLSGSLAAQERKAFSILMGHKLEKGSC